MENKKIRVIMAKPGLDGHDRGIKILARAFRDAGMEVIYLGLRQTPAMIVNAAIQEDADVIALSILSGAHMTIFRKINNLLQDNNIDNMLITGGGIIATLPFADDANFPTQANSTAILFVDEADGKLKLVSKASNGTVTTYVLSTT